MVVTMYSDADLFSAYKQKNRVLGVFWSVTLVYAIVAISMLIYHISLPYASELDGIPKAVTYVCSAVYVVFVFPFMAIKYSRVRKYVTMLSFLSTGLKMTETNYFYTFRQQTLQKDNIDVLSCIFATWSKKKEEWMEREIYADVEKARPDFGGGDLVRYVTQSNILVQYEVLQRHAYDFYEEDEEGNEKPADTATQDTPQTIESEQETTKEETEGEEV